METLKEVVLLTILSISLGLAGWWAAPFDDFWLPRFILFLLFETSVVMSIFSSLALIAFPFIIILKAVQNDNPQ